MLKKHFQFCMLTIALGVSAFAADSPRVIRFYPYPKLLTYSGISAVIAASVSIDKSGNVISVETSTISGDANGILSKHAIKVFKNWKFENNDKIEKVFKWTVEYILLPEQAGAEDEDYFELCENRILRVFSKRKVSKDVDRFR